MGHKWFSPYFLGLTVGEQQDFHIHCHPHNSAHQNHLYELKSMIHESKNIFVYIIPNLILKRCILQVKWRILWEIPSFNFDPTWPRNESGESFGNLTNVILSWTLLLAITYLATWNTISWLTYKFTMALIFCWWSLWMKFCFQFILLSSSVNNDISTVI